MDKIISIGLISAVWINPATGDRTVIGKFNNSGIQTFTVPEEWNDALLLLEGAGSIPITSRLAISKNKRYFVNEKDDPVLIQRGAEGKSISPLFLSLQ